MYERRAMRRRHLMFHLRVFDADSGEQIGNVFDITPEGLMVTGEQRQTLGQRRRLVMFLPVDVQGAERIDFAGTVAWSNDDICPGLFDTGFRDLEMESVDRERIAAVIDEFGMRETV